MFTSFSRVVAQISTPFLERSCQCTLWIQRLLGSTLTSCGGKNTESGNSKQSSLILTGCVGLLCLKHGGGCCSVTKSRLTFCNPLNYGMSGSSSYSMSWSLLRFMSIESLIPYSHCNLCCPFSVCPQSFPASGSFLMSRLFTSSGQSTGASASASALPLSLQG